jgi:putative oxidoreductase
LPCSCGGVISSMSWKQHLVFNVHCIAINIVAINLFKRDMQQKFIT